MYRVVPRLKGFSLLSIVIIELTLLFTTVQLYNTYYYIIWHHIVVVVFAQKCLLMG